MGVTVRFSSNTLINVMITIANSVASKLAVAFVATAMMFSLVAPAQAQTAEELQAQIDTLMATITALQAQLGVDGGGSTSSSDVCPYTWTRSLNMGDTGADVMKLQQFLNAEAATRVAVSGAGSVGAETSYYGPATGAAVAKFQEMHRAAVLSPLDLVNSTTFFGNSTRAQANALCVAAPVVVNEGTDTDSDSDSASLGGDEGSISALNQVSPDESTLEEGTTSGLMAFTAEAEGDVEVDRLDVFLDSTSAGAQSDNADDYFEGAELLVNGEKVAELDVADFREETSYAGSNDNVVGDTKAFRLRFSNLGLVFEDGDEPEFQIAFTAVGNVDSDDLTEVWGLDNPVMRFMDGQGFSDSITDATIAETFSFDAEEKAQYDITKASNSPDGTTVEVDADNKSGEIAIFVFEIDEENGVDSTIDAISMTASTTDGDVTTTIDEVILLVDGDVIGSDSPAADGALLFENLDFDIDGDETVEVTAHVVFKRTSGYTEGDSMFLTFTAVTEATDVNGNDEGDITGAENAADFSSETFTLRSTGMSLTAGEADTVSESDSNGDTAGGEVGSYVMKFDVTAFGDKMYIPTGATIATSSFTAGKGVSYAVEDADGTQLMLNAAGLGSTTAVVASSASLEGAYFMIPKGGTESFTITVSHVSVADGFFRGAVHGVSYNVGAAAVADTLEVSVPAEDFETDYINLDV